jgi:hypothetical protein
MTEYILRRNKQIINVFEDFTLFLSFFTIKFVELNVDSYIVYVGKLTSNSVVHLSYLFG